MPYQNAPLSSRMVMGKSHMVTVTDIEREFGSRNDTSSGLVYRPELKGDLCCLQLRNIIKKAMQPMFRTVSPGCAEILSDYGESGGNSLLLPNAMNIASH